MSSKLPALLFYAGDWRKDTAVQALDYEHRGVWFELLMLMHESEDRGRLVLNGQPMPDDAAARLLGLSEAKWKQVRSTLVSYGVASEEAETGVLYNRRMVRDEAVRRAKAEAGRKGGLKSRPPRKEAPDEAETEAGGKQNGTSSVSSSSSDEKPRGCSDDVWAVFQHWRTARSSALGKTSGPPMQPSSKRLGRIRARLDDGYSPADLEDAVAGCLSNPHNVEGGFTDIELICRDQQHVEQYLAWHRNGRRENGRGAPPLARLLSEVPS